MTQGDMETGRREKKDRDTERCETIETGRRKTERQGDSETGRQGDRKTGGGRCGEGTTRRTPNLLNVGNSKHIFCQVP